MGELWRSPDIDLRDSTRAPGRTPRPFCLGVGQQDTCSQGSYDGVVSAASKPLATAETLIARGELVRKADPSE